MTLYVGEAVRIRTVVIDPDTGNVLTPPPTSVIVEFWGPGKNPIKDASVRGAPDKGSYPLDYRIDEQDFVYYADTTGWTAGKWTYRVTVSRSNPSHTNWEYATLVLKP